MIKTPEKYPALMIVVGVIGISLSSILVRYSESPSLVTAAFRLLWTVALMTPVVFGRKEIRRELLSVSRKNLLISALSGMLLALHFGTWFESLRHTTVAVSTIIVCTEAIWVALGYRIFMKGQIGRKAWIAIFITLAGSVLIAVADAGAPGENGLYGDLLAFVAAIAVCGYTLLGREARKELSTPVYTYIVYVCCAAALAAGAFLFHQSFSEGFGSGLVIGFLLAIVSTILGHSVFSWCLRFFSPSFVSASKLCEPVVAGIFAAILFGELPGVLQILGGAVVLGGVVWYTLMEIGGQKSDEQKSSDQMHDGQKSNGQMRDGQKSNDQKRDEQKKSRQKEL